MMISNDKPDDVTDISIEAMLHIGAGVLWNIKGGNDRVLKDWKDIPKYLQNEFKQSLKEWLFGREGAASGPEISDESCYVEDVPPLDLTWLEAKCLYCREATHWPEKMQVKWDWLDCRDQDAWYAKAKIASVTWTGEGA